MLDQPTDAVGSLPKQQPQWQVFLAGSVAGLSVDTSLYPIDTIKSRLQSKQGFFAAGGFSRLYRGLPPVLAGSIPNAALFFVTYEAVKRHLAASTQWHSGFNHFVAACLGETVSCTIRVPYEIVKMRSQTSLATKVRSIALAKDIVALEGLAGLYRGITSTIIRDVPFSAIQYPVWEAFKMAHSRRQGKPATVTQSALYGSLAGAFSAFVTTPLDVAKTRIMLAESTDVLASGKVSQALAVIYQQQGLRGLFAGVTPRVIWISAGAAIFLGAYEQTLEWLL